MQQWYNEKCAKIDWTRNKEKDWFHKSCEIAKRIYILQTSKIGENGTDK